MTPAERVEWASGDGRLARTVWERLSGTAQELLSVLIDHPGRKFSGNELAEMLSLSKGNHGIAGTLAWPGRHSYEVGRRLPWSWDYPEKNGPAIYWFEPDIAELFSVARAHRD